MFRTFVLCAICLSPASFSQAQLGNLFGQRPKIESIETRELSSMLKKRSEIEAKAKENGTDLPPPDFVLVDVRSETEIAVSVLPGAITQAAFEKDKSTQKSKLVIPYCTIGGRSGRYASQLAKEGFRVKNYKGSILDWTKHELPLVTLEGQSTHRVHTYSSRYTVPKMYEQVTD